MTDVRKPGLVIKMTPGEKGLVDSLRRAIAPKEFAPVVREALLESAKRLTADEEHNDADA